MRTQHPADVSTLLGRIRTGLASRSTRGSQGRGAAQAMFIGPRPVADVAGRWTRRPRPIAEQAGDDLFELAAELLEVLAHECATRHGLEYHAKPERRDTLSAGLDLAERVLKETGISTGRSQMLIERLGAALDRD